MHRIPSFEDVRIAVELESSFQVRTLLSILRLQKYTFSQLMQNLKQTKASTTSFLWPVVTVLAKSKTSMGSSSMLKYIFESHSAKSPSTCNVDVISARVKRVPLLKK